jgi:hypothetical protein
VPADIHPRCGAAAREFKLRGDAPVAGPGFLGHGLRPVQGREALPATSPDQLKGVNGTIDESARMKWSTDPLYRPYNLAHAAGRTAEDAVYSHRDVTGAAELTETQPCS